AKAAEDAAAAKAAAKAAKAAAKAAAQAGAPAVRQVPATEKAETAPVVPVLPVQPDAATGAAPVAEATAAPASDAAGGTVVEEVVTKESARSSAEDFANTVTGKPKDARKKKDKGLDDTEKLLLLGLGAVAVGSMLSNNRKVELNSGDRVVVTRPDGTQQVIKNDDALLRQPGATLRTETFDDGSTRTTVLREDGSRVITVRDAEYRVLRRVHVDPRGRETVLIDDTVTYQPVDVTRLPPPAPPARIDGLSDEAALRAALAREGAFDRRFSLSQVRDIARVRALVPEIDFASITFDTGSAAIAPEQARALSGLGRLIQDFVAENPREVFLIEGHTDAVGSAAANLALSDRRAETVALALTEYFGVPPENLVVQGYGEEFLRVPTDAAERANRRVAVRRITDLLRTAAAD
ncbi:MAG: OmpA family protein, partial [Pseudomonadota bacterium]